MFVENEGWPDISSERANIYFSLLRATRRRIGEWRANFIYQAVDAAVEIGTASLGEKMQGDPKYDQDLIKRQIASSVFLGVFAFFEPDGANLTAGEMLYEVELVRERYLAAGDKSDPKNVGVCHEAYVMLGYAIVLSAYCEKERAREFVMFAGERLGWEKDEICREFERLNGEAERATTFRTKLAGCSLVRSLEQV